MRKTRTIAELDKLVATVESLVERMIPENFEEYTLDQLRDRVWDILFDALEEANAK